MEFIPYLIFAAFAAMSVVMFNLYTRVRELEDAVDGIDVDFDHLDRDLDQDFERLYNDLARDFEEIKTQLATR